MVKTWQISRRTMLRGVGVSMALPLLDAMTSATVRAGEAAATTMPSANAAPVRFACLYMPNGVAPKWWQPTGVGRGFELSQTLSPLAPHKDELLVLSHLWNKAATQGDGHYVKTAGFLTGCHVNKTTGKDISANGVSADQVIARHAGRETPLPSLELGIEPVTVGIDSTVGFTRLYGAHIAWRTPTNPVAKEINPRLAFDRLFKVDGATSSAADDQSVLDLVAEDAKRLRANVGQHDRLKLDEYFESVRSVERRIEFNTKRRAEESHVRPEVLQEIEALDKRVVAWANHPDRDKLSSLNFGADHTDHVRLMLDLMVLAFWSDSTRVSTFMFGNAVSQRNFSFLPGVHGAHHELSHHKNEAATLEQYQRINQWHVAQLAYMLERMRSIKEGAGTLLDNSMVLFGAGMRDGNQHNPHDLPLVLAGRGGGAISTGRHVRFEKDTPLCNLYRSIFEIAGAPVDRFGDSTGTLPGLGDASFAGVGA
jgi:hypothetical protein